MSASEKGYNFVSGQKELDKIHKLLNENSKMSSEAKAKIKAYYAEIESGTIICIPYSWHDMLNDMNLSHISCKSV